MGGLNLNAFLSKHDGSAVVRDGGLAVSGEDMPGQAQLRF